MNTFVPLADSYAACARVLDRARLGKQRIETRQLVDAIEGRSKGWRRHPACAMWEECVVGLKQYHNAVITEWVTRGYRNGVGLYNVEPALVFPVWWGEGRSPSVHRSHRAALLYKDSAWYGKFQWVERGLVSRTEVMGFALGVGYVWP